MTIIEGLFHSPQTLNGHVKKGTGSLIRLPGVTTIKWLQVGAALMFLSNLPSLLKMTPWTSKVADQSTNRLEAYLVGQTNCSDKPNMSISTNLSVTGRCLWYNGKINNIGRPTKQISSTDQIFFQSSTSQPIFTLGIP